MGGLSLLHPSIDVPSYYMVACGRKFGISTASCGSNIEPASSTARLLFMRLVSVCGGARSTGIADHVDIGLICLTVLHVTRVYYHAVGVLPRGPL